MKFALVLIFIFSLFSLPAEIADLEKSSDGLPYRFIDDYPPDEKTIVREYDLDPGVLFYKIYYRSEERVSISKPKLKSDETFQYKVLNENSDVSEKILPLDLLNNIQVNFKKSHKYNQAAQYYFYTLSSAMFSNLLFNKGKFLSELNTLMISIPIYLSSLSLPLGVSNLYSYEGRSFFDKRKEHYSGVGLSAGTWPFSSNFKIERYDDKLISSFGANVYSQKPYLPYGFALKVHYSSLKNISHFKSGDYELLINPSLKLCLMEWKRFRSFLYLGLISYSRKVHQTEAHINQYPYDDFYSRKDLSGNSLEAELQYFLNKHFSLNFSLACFTTARRSRYPVFAGLTYHISTQEPKPVTLSNINTGMFYQYLEITRKNQLTIQRTVGLNITHEMNKTNEVSYAVLLDFETDGSPIAHSFQYTRYNKNTGPFFKPGISLGSIFGKIYEDHFGFPIGITAKLMISKFVDCYIDCNTELICLFQEKCSALGFGFGFDYRFPR